MSIFRQLFAASILALAATPAVAQGGPPAMPVGVAEPLAKRVTQWDESSGRFEALASVEVRARVSGFIDKVNFVDGATVKAGNIARNDSANFTLYNTKYTLPELLYSDWVQPPKEVQPLMALIQSLSP